MSNEQALEPPLARKMLVEFADNAGAFDPREVVVSIDDALRVCTALAARPSPAREALQACVDALTKHHQWHAAQTEPDPEHGFIPADEYADSALYEATVEAASKANWILADGNVNQARALKSHPPSDMAVKALDTADADTKESRAEFYSANEPDSTGRRPGEPFDPDAAVAIGRTIDAEDGGYPSDMGEDATAGEFVMVPREPTEAMVLAAYTPESWLGDAQLSVLIAGIRKRWSAMIDAAPKPTQPIGMDEREKIAREIDPEAFASMRPERIALALAAADRRLALSATPVDVGEVVEVLEPFAAAAVNTRPDFSDQRSVKATIALRKNEVAILNGDIDQADFVVSLDGISVGDLRRARALHDRLTGKDRG